MIQVRYATESDVPSLAHINIASFKHQPLWGNVFPSIETSAVLPIKMARFFERLKKREAHILVAVDTSSLDEKILGYAWWTIPESCPPRPKSTTIQSEEAINMVKSLTGSNSEEMRQDMYDSIIWTLKQKRAEYVEREDIGMLLLFYFLFQVRGRGDWIPGLSHRKLQNILESLVRRHALLVMGSCNKRLKAALNK